MRILVFGYFGYVTGQLDGQTVKTRAVYNLVRANAETDTKVSYADSQQFRHSPGAVLRFIRDLARCNTLIWLPAHNNLKYLFPLVWYASRLFRFRIVYVVIGGWLSQMLKGLGFHRRLGHIAGILVENNLTVKELGDEFGFTNVAVIPNFREQLPHESQRTADGHLRLVFMARINRKKGLEAIAAICPNLPPGVSIDFFGPINDEDREYFFNELVDRYPVVNYGGTLEPELINDTLRQYDAMLLPTRYYTEGLPGSIVDAYQAGIPVIVTRWKHAAEFVADGRTGFIVDFENPVPGLLHAVERMAEDGNELATLKANALAEGNKYTPAAAWSVLSKTITKKQ